MAKTEFMDEIVLGDCLDLFPTVTDKSVQTIHTSPPYNIERNYNGYDDKLSQEEILPLRDSRERGRDPVGLLSIVDRAFERAYKLHKVYSSAMRLHCVAKWINSLRNAIGQNENRGWRQILRSLAQSEPGRYRLDKDRITLIGSTESIKNIETEAASRKTLEREPVNSTLF